MKIVFFGEDAFSNVVLLSLIKSGHQVSLVVTPYYNNAVYKKLEFTCERNNIPLLRIEKINGFEVETKIREIAPDIGIVAHFEKLIKPNLLSVPKYGFLNLHPSLLPNYRGMAPQHWPIINGEKFVGITVHKIDEGIDTGDIVLQRKFELPENAYVKDLQKLWIEYYKSIMIDALDNIERGEKLIPQSHLVGSYYGRLTDEQCLIDVSKSAKEVLNLIKGVSFPYRGARCYNYRIFEAYLGNNDDFKKVKEQFPTNGIYCGTGFGNIIKLSDGFLIIKKMITYESANY